MEIKVLEGNSLLIADQVTTWLIIIDLINLALEKKEKHKGVGWNLDS